MGRLFVIAAVLCVAAAPVFAGHGGEMGFSGDIEKKQSEAKMFGKPAAYYFTSAG